jgi:hypothetical protein
MILYFYSDASYLSESDTQSRTCSHFFMGWTPKDGNPIKLNGAFFTLCAILCFVVASAAKAELGALFLNCKKGMIFLTHVRGTFLTSFMTSQIGMVNFFPCKGFFLHDFHV